MVRAQANIDFTQVQHLCHCYSLNVAQEQDNSVTHWQEVNFLSHKRKCLLRNEFGRGALVG